MPRRALPVAVLVLAASAPAAHGASVVVRPTSPSSPRAAFVVRGLSPLQIIGARVRDADGSRRRLRVSTVRAAVRAHRAVRVRLRPGPRRRAVRLILTVDRFAPTRPGIAHARVAGALVELTWAPAEDDRRVARYLVWRAAAGRAAGRAPLESTRALTIDDAPGAGTWRYEIAAADPSGNVGRRVTATATISAAAAANDGGAGAGPRPPGAPPGPAHPGGPRTAVVAAVGDIACSPGSLPRATGCRQADVGSAIGAQPFDAVLALGDLQYPNGALAPATPFDLAFGAFKASIRPVPGNHEYMTTGATNYYDYFGAVAGARDQGYYSFDVGAWHVVALNSNCTVVACDALSPQAAWLSADLAAHPARCTLAYMHHALFASGPHGDHPALAPLWQILQDAGADLVLAAHDHLYEHLAALTAAGVVDPAGIPSFIVGTGGASHDKFKPLPVAGSLMRDETSFGYLELTLRPDSYDWTFRPVADGLFTDSGSAACR